ncbi:MAG: acyl-CoA dehydrogenase family protein, partial [Actinomycetota bacterium]
MTDAFSLPEELETFRKAVRAICDDGVAPRAVDIDETDEFPHDVHRLLVEHELMAVGFPEEFGGAGESSLSFAVMIEEISRASASVSLIPL